MNTHPHDSVSIVFPWGSRYLLDPAKIWMSSVCFEGYPREALRAYEVYTGCYIKILAQAWEKNWDAFFVRLVFDSWAYPWHVLTPVDKDTWQAGRVATSEDLYPPGRMIQDD